MDEILYNLKIFVSIFRDILRFSKMFTCVPMNAANATQMFHKDDGKARINPTHTAEAIHIPIVENDQSSPPNRMPPVE